VAPAGKAAPPGAVSAGACRPAGWCSSDTSSSTASPAAMGASPGRVTCRGVTRKVGHAPSNLREGKTSSPCCGRAPGPACPCWQLPRGAAWGAHRALLVERPAGGGVEGRHDVVAEVTPQPRPAGPGPAAGGCCRKRARPMAHDQVRVEAQRSVDGQLQGGEHQAQAGTRGAAQRSKGSRG
jgi:hypothetical protein